MTTLTITLDDSPEAQLIIQLLKQATVVTSLEESAAHTATRLDFPVIQRGNPALIDRPTESVWEGALPRVEEIRRNWDERNREQWDLLRANPNWPDKLLNNPDQL